MADYKIYSKYGVISQVDIYGKNSKQPIKKQYYKLGQLVSADFDSNGDGVYDITYKYDRYEEIK